jgi:hypothetical protein
MAKLLVNKKVLRKAEAIVAEGKRPVPTVDQPLPVCTLWYPIHGIGPEISQRFVQVTEMNQWHIKGFEIASEYDEEPGKPHTYLRLKIPYGLSVALLHFKATKKD